MTNIDKRTLLKSVVASSLLSPISAFAAPASKGCDNTAAKTNQSSWPQGLEGQRQADLGNGYYLNPIMPGDYPDPTVLKDGDDYYMTFSSFDNYPGIVIWHSKDLVNWTPIGPALHTNIGTVWALDICKHQDRYYIYIPAAPAGKPWGTYVIWADNIAGPWSEPVNLHIDGCIDPGHAVGEDGKRYLFVNGIRKIKLKDNGLATDGQVEPAYQPWVYPDHWITENFAPEGPKITRYKDYFYLVTAVGGTAGPVTGHMVIAARAKSIHGPWEHCPHNPLVRSQSTEEPWWSRGHATLIEGPNKDWWMIYHGYENGFRTLGRQTLLEPIKWTEDGWFKAKGGDLSKPMKKPANISGVKNGLARSDDFSTNKFGLQWAFHKPSNKELERINYSRFNSKPALSLIAVGTNPSNSSPMVCNAIDRSYQVEVSMTLEDKAEAGLLLFYNHRAFVGMGTDGNSIKSFQYAEEHPWARIPNKSKQLKMRLTNDNNVITYHYSTDNGLSWQRHPTRMEVAGINHNVFGGFLSLRIGLYCCGQGRVILQDFKYQAL